MAPKLTPEQIAATGESKQHTIVGVLVMLMLIGNLSVALRIKAQIRVARRIFTEDVFIIIALVFADTVAAFYFASVHNGLGLHAWRVVAEDPYQMPRFFQYQYLAAVFNGPVFASIKLSLLFFYRRIFVVSQKWIIAFWWINVIYNVLWFFGSTAFYIFQCFPPSFYWMRLYPVYHLDEPYPIVGECDPMGIQAVVIPLIFGLIADIATLIMPVLSLARLHMSPRRKIALLILFSFGLLACLLELVRIVITDVDTDDKTDPTWGIATFAILTVAEEMTAIMCACVPLIASQWKYTADKIRSSQGNSGSRLPLRVWRYITRTSPTSSATKMETGSAEHNSQPRPTGHSGWSAGKLNDRSDDNSINVQTEFQVEESPTLRHHV